MRTETKSILTGLLFVVLLCLLVGMIIFVPTSTNTASAAITNSSRKYKLDVDAVGADGVWLYSNDSSIEETISDGAIFKFAPTTFEVVLHQKTSYGRYTYTRYIKNVELTGPVTFSEPDRVSNTSQFGTKTVTYNFPALTEGIYTLSFRTGADYSGVLGDVSADIVFTFYYDLTAPTISGASTSSSGLKTNKSFTVTANDSVSGVSNLYMCAPGSSTYSAVSGTTKTISNGSKNGLYQFYAKDNADNVSATYYVLFDDTLPTLSCSGGEFGKNTNSGFTVTAKDTLSSVTLYYKVNSGSWISSGGSSYTVNDSAEDGTYYFYAVDACNNKTAEVWIQLGADLAGRFVKSDEDNSVYFTWDRASWTATLDGNNYTKGTWITREGEHTIKLSSGNNRTAVYTYTIEHNYVENVILQPTCLTDGESVYQCTQCGSSYKGRSSEATGHYYVPSTVAATCTSGGYTIYTCTRCGDTYKDNEVQPLGHSLISSVVSPTCTGTGYTQFECSRCDYSYRSGTTQATGHNYFTKTVAATCIEGGYTLHTCGKCGDSYKDNYTQAIGHNYESDYRAPTCTDYGRTIFICQVCGHEYSESDGTYPKGHNYSNTILTAPTCTTDGLRESVCDDCGLSYQTVIPATGHNYQITDVTSSGGVTKRIYACSECGHSYTQELGDQHEEITNYVEYLFEQYEPYMWWVLLAAAGVWSIVIGVMIAIAQKNEDKEKAKKMLVNFVIGLVVIAIIVVACPLLIRGIATLVT